MALPSFIALSWSTTISYLSITGLIRKQENSLSEGSMPYCLLSVQVLPALFMRLASKMGWIRPHCFVKRLQFRKPSLFHKSPLYQPRNQNPMATLFPELNGAYFSLNREYRFALWRIRDSSKPLLLFVGLNPSMADETQDDPTIRRLKRFVKDWGYGGFYIVNLFGVRATDPAQMKAHPDPVGPTNNYWINWAQQLCDRVVFIWGVHGSHQNRDQALINHFPGAYCLGQTQDGHPKHPLYLPATTQLTPFITLTDNSRT